MRPLPPERADVLGMGRALTTSRGPVIVAAMATSTTPLAARGAAPTIHRPTAIDVGIGAFEAES
jgi:hypothetical protein